MIKDCRWLKCASVLIRYKQKAFKDETVCLVSVSLKWLTLTTVHISFPSPCDIPHLVLLPLSLGEILLMTVCQHSYGILAVVFQSWDYNIMLPSQFFSCVLPASRGLTCFSRFQIHCKRVSSFLNVAEPENNTIWCILTILKGGIPKYRGNKNRQMAWLKNKSKRRQVKPSSDKKQKPEPGTLEQNTGGWMQLRELLQVQLGFQFNDVFYSLQDITHYRQHRKITSRYIHVVSEHVYICVCLHVFALQSVRLHECHRIGLRLSYSAHVDSLIWQEIESDRVTRNRIKTPR